MVILSSGSYHTIMNQIWQTTIWERPSINGECAHDIERILLQRHIGIVAVIMALRIEYVINVCTDMVLIGLHECTLYGERYGGELIKHMPKEILIQYDMLVHAVADGI